MHHEEPRKWYVRLNVWIPTLLILGSFFLPSLLSTRAGTTLLLLAAEKISKKEISVKSISLQWWGPQKGEGIQVKDPENHLFFSCATAETQTPLWRAFKLNGNLQIQGGELVITPSELSPITFSEMEISIHAQAHNGPLSFAITGNTEQQGEKGYFNIQGDLHSLKRGALEGSIKAKISQLPVAGLDQLLHMEGTLLASVGSRIDITLQAEKEKERIQCDLQAQSPQLTTQCSLYSENQVLKLKAPGNLEMTLTPPLLKKYGKIEVKDPVLLKGTLSQFSCPFSLTGLNYPNLSFQAALEIEQLSFADLLISRLGVNLSSPFLEEGVLINLQMSSPQATLSEASFFLKEELHLVAPVEISYPLDKGNPLILKLQTFSLPLSFNLEKMRAEATYKLPAWNLEGTFSAQTWETVELYCSGKNFNTAVQGKLEPGAFLITKPFTVSALLSTQNLESHFPEASLAKPATVRIEMEPLAIPLPNFTFNALRCQGKCVADEILFVSKTGGKEFPVKNGSVQFSFDGLQHRAETIVSAKIGEGKLDAKASFAEFFPEDTSQALLSAQGTLQNLTPEFFDLLTERKFSLGAFLGSSLDLTFKLDSFPDRQTLSLKAKSPNLYCSGKLLFKDSKLQLESPGLDLNFNLTQEAYNLIHPGPFILQAPAMCACTIQELEWPVKSSNSPSPTIFDRIPQLGFDWGNAKLKGNLLLKELNYSQFSLQQTQVNFSKAEGVKFQMSSKLLPQGEIALTGQIPQNDLSEIKIDGVANNFPTLILDLAARLMGQKNLSFLPVFGKTLNAKATVDLKKNQGPLSLSITSENTRASLSGEVENGFLTLTEPLHAQVLMTPELSALLLKEVNPLSISEITSQSPITLEIASAGFLLPLIPFDSSKLFIGKARLELGKISCRNEGNISTTLGLLKWGKIGRGDSLKLWFTPLELSAKQGILSLDRTEILVADTLEIALWGTLNLPKNQVDMTLGLTPSALRAAFGIKNLPKNYLLHIPMRGPLTNVSIDTGSATAKIALLLAWQQKALAGALGGGGTGALFGELLQKAVPLPDMHAKSPPAKHPFPWEVSEKQKTASRPIKKGDKPLKQLLKLVR